MATSAGRFFVGLGRYEKAKMDVDGKSQVADSGVE
jgi:hypothetical protein